MKISEFTVTKLFCLFPARLRYEEYFYKVEERERERGKGEKKENTCTCAYHHIMRV